MSVCQEDRSGGLWLPAEATFHITCLELKAAFFALQCFETKISNKHARLLLDNSTAVAINNMVTSHSVTRNQMAFSIWQWCVWVSAAHIPGKENTAADAESRKINVDAEWKLDKAVLEQAFAAQLQGLPFRTLRESLSGTFLQTLPDFVTPLKGHFFFFFFFFFLALRCCPATQSAPSERFGY